MKINLNYFVKPIKSIQHDKEINNNSNIGIRISKYISINIDVWYIFCENGNT